MYEVFAPLFSKSGRVSGQRPDSICKNKKDGRAVFFYAKRISVFLVMISTSSITTSTSIPREYFSKPFESV